MRPRPGRFSPDNPLRGELSHATAMRGAGGGSHGSLRINVPNDVDTESAMASLRCAVSGSAAWWPTACRLTHRSCGRSIDTAKLNVAVQPASGSRLANASRSLIR